MSIVQQFDELVEIAQQLGYKIRYDYFGGTGGGVCEYGGTKWLFIDLGMSTVDRLEKLQTILSIEPLLDTLRLSPQRQQLLGLGSRAA